MRSPDRIRITPEEVAQSLSITGDRFEELGSILNNLLEEVNGDVPDTIRFLYLSDEITDDERIFLIFVIGYSVFVPSGIREGKILTAKMPVKNDGISPQGINPEQISGSDPVYYG
jgi:hypothetical protein